MISNFNFLLLYFKGCGKLYTEIFTFSELYLCVSSDDTRIKRPLIT